MLLLLPVAPVPPVHLTGSSSLCTPSELNSSPRLPVADVAHGFTGSVDTEDASYGRCSYDEKLEEEQLPPSPTSTSELGSFQDTRLRDTGAIEVKRSLWDISKVPGSVPHGRGPVKPVRVIVLPWSVECKLSLNKQYAVIAAADDEGRATLKQELKAPTDRNAPPGRIHLVMEAGQENGTLVARTLAARVGEQ